MKTIHMDVRDFRMVYFTTLPLSMLYIEGPTSPFLGTHYLIQSKYLISIRLLFGFFIVIFFIVIRKRTDYSYRIDSTI